MEFKRSLGVLLFGLIGILLIVSNLAGSDYFHHSLKGSFLHQKFGSQGVRIVLILVGGALLLLAGLIWTTI